MKKRCCVWELEGSLLKDPDTFAYLMLVAFEASGLIRFTALLLAWPLKRALEAAGKEDLGLRLTVFVATVGLRVGELESVAKAVLPKFMYDDVDMEAWRAFAGQGRRVVATRMPRLMVERFVKEHLQADEVVATELVVTRFGFLTGCLRDGGAMDKHRLLAESSLSKEQCDPTTSESTSRVHQLRPIPVIFHDGRLVKRPTPSTALLILLWLPMGILLAGIRILAGLVLPMWATRYFSMVFGGGVVVRGNPPPPHSASRSSQGGVLFVSTHRTLMDPVILSYVLKRRIPAVTYSISRLSEIISPIPTVRLTRVRHVDAARIKLELSKGDLVVCPEGTTCREPFLLRFSALFAELTDRIVPVAMNYRVGFFHATTARGWKALDPIFFFMNPRPVYEVTFLNQLPHHATCSAGKTPHDVANYVQKILAATLGFECTNLTRKDKYRLLAGNDGTVGVHS